MIKKIQKNSYEYVIQEQRALMFYLENLHCLIPFIFLQSTVRMSSPIAALFLSSIPWSFLMQRKVSLCLYTIFRALNVFLE